MPEVILMNTSCDTIRDRQPAMRLAELAKAEHAPPTDESEKSQNEKDADPVCRDPGHWPGGTSRRSQEIWRRQILW
ncbi:conserved hypothetical protein [Aeromonas veronii]|uniref:Uncharacterized protein n=1 Tax=Aeromonas veronii TaxID=654 RepID=A0A653KSG6_AERVE|nr:conserved hypothetical protein [Aeromonas veronii]